MATSITHTPSPATPAPVAADDADRRFCRDTLPRVSRTFALNMRLLDGTFNLGDSLNWPSGVGLGLVGSGWGTVLKLAAGVNDYAINFSGDDTRSTFSDFTIDGNHTNQSAGPTGGIWADGAVECVFQRIHFTHGRARAHRHPRCPPGWRQDQRRHLDLARDGLRHGQAHRTGRLPQRHRRPCQRGRGAEECTG